MNKPDVIDKVFNFLENKTSWLYKEDLIKNWFNILSWSALTSLVFAMYFKSGYYLLLVVGLTSALLVFFYSWHSIFDGLARVSQKTEVSLITKICLMVLGLLGPAATIFYLLLVLEVVLLN